MTERPSPPTHAHFKGKEALEHVIEAQAKAIIASAEVHGVETPGHLSAGADAARETAVVLAMLWALLSRFPSDQIVMILAIFSVGWFVWKVGRASWLSWSRLERLHRVIAEERWEIEHHRTQEREELKELYAAKGFQGKLLEDVLDVLMADGDRLLRVMLEEELGLSLNVHEHPLKQGAGAGLGVLISAVAVLMGVWIHPVYGMAVSGLLVLGISAAIAAKFERNRIIPAIVWNIGIAGLAFGAVYWFWELLTDTRHL